MDRKSILVDSRVGRIVYDEDWCRRPFVNDVFWRWTRELSNPWSSPQIRTAASPNTIVSPPIWIPGPRR